MCLTWWRLSLFISCFLAISSAQMCPGVYEARHLGVNITIPGYGPYSGTIFNARRIGLNAINTTTCYIYYDLFAYTPLQNGTLPRITVGPIECDFGLTQKIGFATLNKTFCTQGGDPFCCAGICKGISPLPTGVYPYTYFSEYDTLRSITIGQNENGQYWSGLSEAITLVNVNWNEATVSGAATTAISSTTGFASLTSTVTTSGVAATTSASTSAEAVSTTAVAAGSTGLNSNVVAAQTSAATVSLSTSNLNAATYVSTSTSSTTAATTTAQATTTTALTSALTTARAAATTAASSSSSSSSSGGTSVASSALLRPGRRSGSFVRKIDRVGNK